MQPINEVVTRVARQREFAVVAALRTDDTESERRVRRFCAVYGRITSFDARYESGLPPGVREDVGYRVLATIRTWRGWRRTAERFSEQPSVSRFID